MKDSQKAAQGTKYLDEILRMGIAIDLQKEDDEPVLTDEDMESLNIPLPPDDMLDRIMTAYNKEQKPIKKGFRWKRAVMIAAVVALLAGGALSVQAVRIYIYKFTSQFVENGINIFGGNAAPQVSDVDDESAYKQAEAEMGCTLLEPKHLPEEIKFKEADVKEKDNVRLQYANDDNSKMIRFSQTIIHEGSASGAIYDGKDTNVSKEVINNYEITIVQRTQEESENKWISAIWNDGVLEYEVATNCEKKELVSFIQNLKK